MRYALDVVFLDDDYRVVRAISELAPGKISPSVRGASSVLELPAGTLTRVGLGEGVRIEIGRPADTRGARTEQSEVSRVRPLWIRCCVWTIGFLLVTSLLVLLGRIFITWQKPCPDFVYYWSAAKILASGHSPYDLDLLSQVQRQYGWEKATDGFGRYDSLPYYYPPSLLGLIAVLLLPLGFSTARIAWLIINTELLFVIAYLLRNAVPGVRRAAPFALVPFFALSIVCVLVGQASMFVFFLVAATWRLLQRGSDRSAGWALAWISVKPHLTTLLLLATLVWSIRQRRWRVIEGFIAGSMVLVALSFWAVPSWPLQLGQLMLTVPTVSSTFPWLGTSWFQVLRSVGLSGWLLWATYALFALPFCWILLRSALHRDSTVDDVFALGILAAFFVAPTVMPYDHPLLIIPLLVLMGSRISDLAGSVLMVMFVILPSWQFWWWAP
jgi:hypothetical protein